MFVCLWIGINPSSIQKLSRHAHYLFFEAMLQECPSLFYCQIRALKPAHFRFFNTMALNLTTFALFGVCCPRRSCATCGMDFSTQVRSHRRSRTATVCERWFGGCDVLSLISVVAPAWLLSLRTCDHQLGLPRRCLHASWYYAFSIFC